MAGNEQDLFETLFTELWSQLWCQARLDFTFSTGSLSGRKFDARPFDLQLAPVSAVRDVVRTSGAILSQPEDSPAPDELELGISSLVADFIDHGLLGLRQFLAEIADADFVRRDAVRAALIRGLLPGGGELSESEALDLLQTVAIHFPTPEKASMLKRYCLTAIERSAIPQVDRWIIIQIATHDFGEAFASAGVGLTDRMTRLINNDSSTALDLLLKLLAHSLSRFGEQIAYSIISTQAEPQVLAFLRRNPQFVSTFVKVRPALASRSEFWTALESHSHEILEAVAAAKTNNPEELNLVFAALFHAQLDREANHFFSLFGSAAVAAVFANRGPYPAHLRDRWIDALAARPDLIESFLQQIEIVTPEILAGVSATYTPKRAADAEFPLEHWLTALATWKPKFAPHLLSTVETCAFSLALAFRLNGKKAADLCQLSFQNAYVAAADQTMPSSVWSMLETLVPHISWSRDWDRCERMRRALIQRFESDQWPLDYLFRILCTKEALSDFVNTALSQSDGRRLLDRIVSRIEAGTLPADGISINILADSLHRSVRAIGR